MNHKEVIVKDQESELALAGCKTSILQLQIEYDDQDAYFNLSVKEAKALADKLNEWVAENEKKMSTICPGCGKQHPLVAEFGYCGKCAQEVYN